MAAMGIDHSKKVLADVAKVAVDIFGIAKHGVGFGALKEIMDLIEKSKELVQEAVKALPELKDLDAAEGAELAAASFDMVKSVIAAIAA